MGKNWQFAKRQSESAEANGCKALMIVAWICLIVRIYPEEIFYSMNIRQTVTERFNPELVHGV